MEPSSLKDDEIGYECQLRGINPIMSEGTLDRTVTVRALRARLREEKKDYKTWPTEPVKTPAEEIPEIYTKQKELEALLAIDVNVRDTVIKNQIYARLCHLETRANRISTDEEDLKKILVEAIAAFTAIRQKFYKTRAIYRPKITPEMVKELEKSLDGTSRGVRSRLSQLDITGETEEEIFSDDLSDEDFEFHSSPKHHKKAKVYRGLPVYKWDVKYSGSREDMAVLDFIAKVNRLMKSEGVSAGELTSRLHHLFKGDAATWYTYAIKSCKSWSDVQFKLKQDFLVKDWRRVLNRQIEEREQRPGEPICIYLSQMEVLFDRLEREKSEEEKLEILRVNLGSEYRNALGINLARVKTIAELKDACQEVESLYPECLAANGRGRRRANIAALHDERGSSSASTGGAEDSGREGRRNGKCWNCDKTGHRSKDCPSEKTLHCYRCGRKDVTVRNCPRCSKN
jgi:hypothetical protein